MSLPMLGECFCRYARECHLDKFRIVTSHVTWQPKQQPHVMFMSHEANDNDLIKTLKKHFPFMILIFKCINLPNLLVYAVSVCVTVFNMDGSLINLTRVCWHWMCDCIQHEWSTYQCVWWMLELNVWLYSKWMNHLPTCLVNVGTKCAAVFNMDEPLTNLTGECCDWMCGCIQYGWTPAPPASPASTLKHQQAAW